VRWPKPDRTWVLLGAAVAAGLLAAWSAREHLRERIAQIEAQSRAPTVRRLVAARDLPAGTRLDADHVAVRDIPAQYAAADTLPPERYGEVDGAMLDRPVSRGDPILPAYLARPTDPPLSSRLSEGRRAVTMPVDEINSLSGMLEPGDIIDLYVSFEHRRRRVTVPLLQGVLVLATGPRMLAGGAQDAGGNVGGYSAITLDVSPQDAVKLVAARQAGVVTAMLRHPRDVHASDAAARGDLASLLGLDPPRPRARQSVPVIYGNRPLARIPDLGAAVSVPPLATQPPQDLPGDDASGAWLEWAQAARDAMLAPGEPSP
jgi:Flp pilus assembly protein CpaB